MRVVILPSDSGYVRVALNKVDKLNVVSLELFDLLVLNLVFLVQPRVFLFERVYLTVERLNDTAVAVSGVSIAFKFLLVLLLVSLPHTVHNPCLFCCQRARHGFFCLLQGGLPA